MLREKTSHLCLCLRDADAKEFVACAAENNTLLRESRAIPSRLGSTVISNPMGTAGAVNNAGEDDCSNVSSDILLSAPPWGHMRGG